VRQDDALVMKGVAASGGRRRGPAKLVWTTDDFKKMKPGDVLVCRSSNVSWIPLFTIAGAVVADVGGALSHAAVVAREFGVPAVVGVGVAFERLRDGMIVEVDGDRGTVRPISATSSSD
jgi:pyruvate,water dikinase